MPEKSIYLNFFRFQARKYVQAATGKNLWDKAKTGEGAVRAKISPPILEATRICYEL